MSFLNSTLIVLGYSICVIGVAWAAPHCSKPIHNEQQCSFKYKEVHYAAAEQHKFVDRKNLTCNSNLGEGSMTLSFTFIRNGKEMKIVYVSEAIEKRQIWMNLPCSTNKDSHTGFNLPRLNELGENDGVIGGVCFIDLNEVYVVKFEYKDVVGGPSRRYISTAQKTRTAGPISRTGSFSSKDNTDD